MRKAILLIVILVLLGGCVRSTSSLDYDSSVVTISVEGISKDIKFEPRLRLKKTTKGIPKGFEQLYLGHDKYQTSVALLKDNGNWSTNWYENYIRRGGVVIIDSNNYSGPLDGVLGAYTYYEQCVLRRWVFLPFSKNYILLIVGSQKMFDTDFSCKKWQNKNEYTIGQKNIYDRFTKYVDQPILRVTDSGDSR